MATNIEIGKKGESLAACWLIMHGFQVLFKNWRQGRGEIDIIARKNNIIHVIEVKTRRSKMYGFPEERIDSSKVDSLLKTTNLFLKSRPCSVEVQFDIISVIILNQEVNYLYIENAFCSQNVHRRKFRMF